MKLLRGLPPFQKKRFRVFLSALLVAVIAWLIINLSKVYTKEVSVDLVFKNLNQGEQISIRDTSINVTIQGRGFLLVNSKLNDLKFPVDLDKFHNYWTWKSERYGFNRMMPDNIKVVNVQPDTIRYKVQELMGKEISIRSNIKVQPKLGYGITNISLSPSKVMVYGDKETLSTINYVLTDSVLVENATTAITGRVALQNNKGLHIPVSEIDYTYAIERFTQGEFLIPVQIKNMPQDREVSIFPKQVNVQFQSALSSFSQYTPEDFHLSVDCNNMDESNTLSIEIDKAPKGVENIRLLKKSVTYLLIEK